MKNKHIIFISSIAVIILLGTIAYALKNNTTLADNKDVKIALFTIPPKEKIFINGVIVPEKVENIYLDDTKGSVNKVLVIDGQVVNKGDALFTYKNDQITSPIDGKVILNNTKDITKPYIVVEATTFYVKGSISEKDQPKLKENQQADILIFSINKTLTGKVKSVGNRPSTSEATTGGSSTISYYDASISLDSQENLIYGFHVQATVKLKEEEIKIPRSSILEEAGKQYVFKVVNAKLTKIEITYKKGESSEVAVLSGINENDKIAITAKDMKEGISVE